MVWALLAKTSRRLGGPAAARLESSAAIALIQRPRMGGAARAASGTVGIGVPSCSPRPLSSRSAAGFVYGALRAPLRHPGRDGLAHAPHHPGGPADRAGDGLKRDCGPERRRSAAGERARERSQSAGRFIGSSLRLGGPERALVPGVPGWAGPAGGVKPERRGHLWASAPRALRVGELVNRVRALRRTESQARDSIAHHGFGTGVESSPLLHSQARRRAAKEASR
jgi:hypothetical protein